MSVVNLFAEAVASGSAPAEEDAVTQRIVDIALAEFLSFGLRRARVDDIARKSAISRMTLHRRFPSKQALITAVVLRELRGVVTELTVVMAEQAGVREKLTEGLIFGLKRTRTHPLFSRLLQTEPETIVPYLTLDGGSIITAGVHFMGEHIRQTTPTGAGGPHLDYAIEAALRLAQSLLLTPHGPTDVFDDDKLRELMTHTIGSLIRPPPASGTNVKHAGITRGW
jgi:AcrR family transcriptional regulator